MTDERVRDENPPMIQGAELTPAALVEHLIEWHGVPGWDDTALKDEPQEDLLEWHSTDHGNADDELGVFDYYYGSGVMDAHDHSHAEKSQGSEQ
jgi:hypothetical protein